MKISWQRKKNCLLRYHFSEVNAYRQIQPVLEQNIGQLLTGEAAELFILGMNEAISNALEYGAAENAVTVTIRRTAEWVVLRVANQGEGFYWKEKLAKIRSEADNLFASCLLDERGRGMRIMYAVSDILRYNREGNEVLLAKKAASSVQSDAVQGRSHCDDSSDGEGMS